MLLCLFVRFVVVVGFVCCLFLCGGFCFVLFGLFVLFLNIHLHGEMPFSISSSPAYVPSGTTQQYISVCCSDVIHLSLLF